MKTATKEHLDLAYTDLRNCKSLITDEFLADIGVQLFKQAIEKSLSAIATEYDLSSEAKDGDVKALYQEVYQYLPASFDGNVLEEINDLTILQVTEEQNRVKKMNHYYEFVQSLHDAIHKMLDGKAYSNVD